PPNRRRRKTSPPRFTMPSASRRRRTGTTRWNGRTRSIMVGRSLACPPVQPLRYNRARSILTSYWGGTTVPVHDWTRVDAGIFHDFHHAWIEEIKRALNRGLLPPDYYALAEQIAGGLGPDVLTLQRPANGLPQPGIP